MLAGAAIVGSHLLSSTTADAGFGFSLVGLILFINFLKYPFLLVGTRFTASTGKSLLEGFKERNPYYLPLFAWMAMDTINNKLVPIKNRYVLFLNSICWIGLIFLTLFSLLFISNSFFGIGIG